MIRVISMNIATVSKQLSNTSPTKLHPAVQSFAMFSICVSLYLCYEIIPFSPSPDNDFLHKKTTKKKQKKL